MRDYIYQLIDLWICKVGLFRAGFITATTLLLIILIGLYIFQLISRKRIREIIIPGENGSLVISSGAVSDMVHAVISTKFKCIAIKKIILWRGKRGIAMELQGSYDIDGGRLPEVAEEMREAVLKNLNGQLGITTVQEVIPHIKKITCQNLNTTKFK